MLTRPEVQRCAVQSGLRNIMIARLAIAMTSGIEPSPSWLLCRGIYDS